MLWSGMRVYRECCDFPKKIHRSVFHHASHCSPHNLVQVFLRLVFFGLAYILTLSFSLIIQTC